MLAHLHYRIFLWQTPTNKMKKTFKKKFLKNRVGNTVNIRILVFAREISDSRNILGIFCK